MASLWSGQPASNRRPTPWQGVVLPTEPCPQLRRWLPAAGRPHSRIVKEQLASIFASRRLLRGAGFHLVGCPGNDPGQPRHRFYRPLRVLSGIPPQVFSTARPQKQGARTAFANPGSLVWNRNLLITQDDYMVILPDCLLSLSHSYPKGRHGKWMQAADEFVRFSAPRMETADAKRHGRPNRPVCCCDIASL